MFRATAIELSDLRGFPLWRNVAEGHIRS